MNGYNMKECTHKVIFLICDKESHITHRCVYPNQPKPAMLALGLVEIMSWVFFMAQHAKANQKPRKDSTLN